MSRRKRHKPYEYFMGLTLKDRHRLSRMFFSKKQLRNPDAPAAVCTDDEIMEERFGGHTAAARALIEIWVKLGILCRCDENGNEE